MDHTDTDDVELLAEVETDTEADPVGEAGSDPAAEAFARLEGEMALMRRAVEHLAAERADIIIPDYGATLGEMAMRLGAMAQGLIAIADKPAMHLTPEGLAARTEAAAQAARRTDHDQLAEARRCFDRGAQDMRGLVGQAHSIAGQRRRLYQVAGSGFLAGILLWSFLPGIIARSMPTSWHWPERMATRMVGAPSPWDAGVRLMQADSPQAWYALVNAADMQHDNRDAIDSCRKAADAAKQPVRCIIRVQGQSRR